MARRRRWRLREMPRHLCAELIFKNGVTLFARAERLQNDELLELGEMVTGFVTASRPVYTVKKIMVDGIRDFIRTRNTRLGAGALASRYGIPDTRKPGNGDPASYMFLMRLKIQ